jgi:enoyl-CoA hydratase/carnithine racemase
MRIADIVRICAALAGAIMTAAPAAADPDYFTAYQDLKMSRDAGVLLVEMHTRGGPIRFSAKDHEEFVDAFYRIGRDRANKVVILTGTGGQWMADIDFTSFANPGDPNNWAKVHDEGTQILENLANIRVPVICAVEGKAWVHTEYCLLANIVVAGEGATFNDLPHFAGGIVPGDGIFTMWAYHVGAGRAQAFLLDPKPITAAQAREWGAVAQVVPDGQAVGRAQEIARAFLQKSELTLRNTRIHFMQPIKRQLIEQVGYGLVLEGESVDALIRSMQGK